MALAALDRVVVAMSQWLHDLLQRLCDLWGWVGGLEQPQATFLGWVVGFFTLVAGALLNAHLNRKRDDRLKGRTLVIVFLRRLVNATWAYRGGRDQMLRCVCAKPSNEMIRPYLNSLSHFESAILNTCLALRTHDALGRLIDPASKYSEAQELIDAYDALRHFDDRIKSRPMTADFTAPVWLVDDGIEFAGEKRKGAKLQKLRFDELADILRKLDSYAHLIAVDVFHRMA